MSYQFSSKHYSQAEMSRVEGRIATAVQAMQSALPVIVLDDDDRENEADLVAAASNLTRDVMARMIRDCSGIVCLCLDAATVDRLELPMMATRNESRYGTPFTVSIEARHGVTTGVSAADRLATVRAAIAPNAKASDIVSPGHMFPLRATPGGVLVRRGHTEGSVNLAEIAGLGSSAVLCELMTREGEMLRGRQAKAYGRRNGFPVLTIEDIVAYRQSRLAKAA